ncbi:2-C-methyl-D-erythritol 4-phosphate cytidylyltransferase [Faecalibacterium duncaniae]|uniref:2-C-methyl-D-erythritol 4-phosphate cytidylyltransferase n=1 Tax=Faecalibacterium duncaniae (strain DSM 17677 / JCM 31915 / A2-165) TaxID=411483 RepID=UPI00249ED56C|nr:2-C-methyl-D-erythritol 4-phosphate cytidylyltransferase [Faecalibacterium duncaniae]
MQKLEKKVSAVLVAAGSSTRMGFDKLSFDLGGETVVQRSIRAFAECPLVSEIVLVAGKNRAFLEQQAGACTKPVQVVQGGATRAESAKNGVLAAHGELVAVHDAARPFVSQAVITAALEAAAACGAAAPAVPVKDTVKRAVRATARLCRSSAWSLIPLTAAPCMRCRPPSASTVRRIWPRWTSWMRKKPAWSPMTAACLN